MIQTRQIHYHHEGVELVAEMAWDDQLSEPRPAVLVAHTWAGRSHFEHDRIKALAALGYVGFACDVYGGGKGGGSMEANRALMMGLMANRPLLQGRLQAAVATLSQQPEVDASKIAALGYCFGGLAVLDLARIGARIGGVVSLHGLFAAPGNTAGNPINARVLVLHGYSDPMVPPTAIIELAAELDNAGADWQLHAYGGTGHAFTNPEANDPARGLCYSAQADRRSWQSVQNFLAEVFADG